MKRVILHHIFTIWQESWREQLDNKLHSVKPVIGAWSVMPMQRTDVKLTRLRIGHTRFTHKHLLLGEDAPECPNVWRSIAKFDSCAIKLNTHSLPALIWEVVALSKLARPDKVETCPDTGNCKYARPEASAIISYPVGKYCDNFDGEIAVTSFAIDKLESCSERNIVLFVYSQAALLSLNSRYKKNALVHSCRMKLIELGKARERERESIAHQWIPRYRKISGNEKTDRLAKAGSLMSQPDSSLPLRNIKRLIYSKLQINSLPVWLCSRSMLFVKEEINTSDLLGVSNGPLSGLGESFLTPRIALGVPSGFLMSNRWVSHSYRFRSDIRLKDFAIFRCAHERCYSIYKKEADVACLRRETSHVLFKRNDRDAAT
ncbi:putative RNA-directed DNA polymerase from transposon X-element [Trichonephila clavipes]|nr:putative RNA-directed DNA polymerase from transposon X-element [Trichonephila clavipes]